jgi:predicted ATP-grasp superfamily ATP-dependent carboligase
MLANADWYGTLTATRVLGEQAIPVYVAADRWLAVARWSRHAAKRLRCPPFSDANRFLDWVCELGQREPGIVLYPTSDDATYLYALRGDQLSRTFRTYQPGLETILEVLDKKRLYGAAREAGLEVPDTWFPETDAEVARIAREAPMPLLVKPRTQVLSATHSKGLIVRKREDLVSRYREFVLSSSYGQALLDRVSDASQAMIQAYLPEGSRQIYVIAAFTARSGALFAARAGLKIFQRPRSLGIGLCFEDAPLVLGLVEASRRLVQRVGYFGLFQLEFIKTADRYLLIDFNPRFYNQLAFDVARGLPLPELVYSAACDNTDNTLNLVQDANEPRDDSDLVFCNRFGLNFMVGAQLLAGRMSAAEARRWLRWHRERGAASIDPAVGADDMVPALVDVAAQLYGCARHPRAFFRSVVLDRTTV